jgi:hypothetical protein
LALARDLDRENRANEGGLLDISITAKHMGEYCLTVTLPIIVLLGILCIPVFSRPQTTGSHGTLDDISAWIETTTGQEDLTKVTRQREGTTTFVSKVTKLSVSISDCNATVEASFQHIQGARGEEVLNAAEHFMIQFTLKDVQPSGVKSGHSDASTYMGSFCSASESPCSVIGDGGFPAYMLVAAGAKVHVGLTSSCSGGGCVEQGPTSRQIVSNLIVIPAETPELAVRMSHAWRDAAAACGGKDVNPTLY